MCCAAMWNEVRAVHNLKYVMIVLKIHVLRSDVE